MRKKIIANYVVFIMDYQPSVDEIAPLICKWRLEGTENREAMAGL